MYGATFEVDHESLKWLSSQNELKGRKAWWAETHQEFDLQICYQKGKYNVVADALSHMPQINELSFTVFMNEFLESLRGLCEHDLSLYRGLARCMRSHLITCATTSLVGT